MPGRIREYCGKTGQKVPATPGQIARVAFESLALRYRQCWQEMETILGRKLEVLHLVGGGCRNQLLNQFTANAIGCKVTTGPVEATAAGNILGQMLAAGDVESLWKGRQIIGRSFGGETFLPREGENAKWQEAFGKFTRLSV